MNWKVTTIPRKIEEQSKSSLEYWMEYIANENLKADEYELAKLQLEKDGEIRSLVLDMLVMINEGVAEQIEKKKKEQPNYEVGEEVEYKMAFPMGRLHGRIVEYLGRNMGRNEYIFEDDSGKQKKVDEYGLQKVNEVTA